MSSRDTIAMVLEAPRHPLERTLVSMRAPGPGEVSVHVRACGVCRTDLHVVDGELPSPKPHLIPGHEVVGVVEERGPGVALEIGARIGVPWLARTCGRCRFCVSGRENLCELASFTGYSVDGGYAEHMIARADFCLPIPPSFSDVAAAPLLCAGLIGHRAYRTAREAVARHALEGVRIGLYGFGAAAHLVAQVAERAGDRVFAFTRPGDRRGQAFARELGAVWAGGSDESPPEPLDTAILFAPIGALVPMALAAVDKGGVVVCAGIHMSDVPSFPYELLYGERVVRSVANLTRLDGREFMALAAGPLNPRHDEPRPLRVVVSEYGLEDANQALADLRGGRLEGAAVLVPRA